MFGTDEISKSILVDGVGRVEFRYKAMAEGWAQRLFFSRIEFSMTVERPLRLPEHPGSALRGAIGWALKEMVCMREDGECLRCPLRPGCAYPSVFEPARPPGVKAFRGERRVPPPYVVRELDRGVELASGGRFRFGVTLIGHAVRLAGHVVEAVRLAGRGGLGAWRVPAIPVEIVQLNGGRVVLDRARLAEGLAPESAAEKAARHGAPWRRVELTFQTPAKIVAEGRAKARPTGPEVLRALLRRVGALAAFHAGGPIGREEYEPMARSADRIEWEAHDVRWVEAERWSNRQGRKTPLGGVLGRYVFSGPELEAWKPWLLAGEALHVGKNASFGLGGYELVVNGGGS